MFSFKFMNKCQAQLPKLSSNIFVRIRPNATRGLFSTINNTKKGINNETQSKSSRRFFHGNGRYSSYPLLVAIPLAVAGAAMCEKKEVPVRAEPVIITQPVGGIVLTESPTQVQIQDRLGRISFGFLMGFMAGYAAKKIGKIVLVAVGSFFLLIQYLSYRGYVSVNWAAVTSKATPITEPAARRRLLQTIVAILTHNLLIKTGFLTGMGVGFRLG